MKEKSFMGVLIFFAIGWFIWSWYSQAVEVNSLNKALNDANWRIEQMDISISEAKGSDWGAYQKMGDSIDNLQPFLIVDSSSDIYK